MSDDPMYPPTNLDDPLGTAVARVCDAVRLLILQHYDEEVRARGGVDFLEIVFTELLAMVLAVQAMQTARPDFTFFQSIPGVSEQLASRVHRYLETYAIEKPATEAESGQPLLPPVPSRLM